MRKYKKALKYLLIFAILFSMLSISIFAYNAGNTDRYNTVNSAGKLLVTRSIPVEWFRIIGRKQGGGNIVSSNGSLFAAADTSPLTEVDIYLGFTYGNGQYLSIKDVFPEHQNVILTVTFSYQFNSTSSITINEYTEGRTLDASFSQVNGNRNVNMPSNSGMISAIYEFEQNQINASQSDYYLQWYASMIPSRVADSSVSVTITSATLSYITDYKFVSNVGTLDIPTDPGIIIGEDGAIQNFGNAANNAIGNLLNLDLQSGYNFWNNSFNVFQNLSVNGTLQIIGFMLVIIVPILIFRAFVGV